MYDELTAVHYAAYRPKLHELLLEKCLDGSNRYNLGLDVGCGTGWSSVALSQYCEKVIAVDPSMGMLRKAIPHQKVEYKWMTHDLDFPKMTFDIITFAGSLYYCKSQTLYDNIVEWSAPGTIVLVYDFNIRMEIFLEALGLNIPPEIEEYNHAVDFSEINTGYLQEHCKVQESILYPIHSIDLAHFLLSHPGIYQNLSKKFSVKNIHHHLTKKIELLPKNIHKSLKADLYYQKYEVMH